MVYGSAQALNSTGGELLFKGCRTQLLRASLAINAPQKKKKKKKKKSPSKFWENIWGHFLNVSVEGLGIFLLD
jgi:hypothetical protein